MLFRALAFYMLTAMAGCVCAAAQNAAPCNYVLSGRVVDEHDRQPLPYANLYVKELKTGSRSDSLGNYVIENLCAGSYTIICSHIGCEDVQKTVVVNGNTIYNFYPEHHARLLGSIEVLSPRERVTASLAAAKLTARELDISRGKTLGEALKSIPGVNALQTGVSISKPIIHGMHSNRVLILNNGVRQEGQQWGSEHGPEIDPFIAGELIVVKGANLLMYGSDALGGVVLVNPAAIRDSAGIGGKVDLSGFSNGRQGALSALLEGRCRQLNALAWRIQATGKLAGNTKTPRYYMKNTGVNELNFSAAAQYIKDKWGANLFYSRFNTRLGIFSASHIGNLTDLYTAFESPVPLETDGFTYRISKPSQHITHDLVKASAFVQTGYSGKLNFIFARQHNVRYEYDKHAPLNDSLAALNKPALLFKITTYTADITWNSFIKKNFSVSAGISGITQGNRYEGRYFIPNFRSFGGGAFIIAKYNTEKLGLEAGIRYDYKWMKVYKWENNVMITPVFRFSNYSASVAGSYRLMRRLIFSVDVASAWRAPAVNELFSDGLHHGAASVEVGDRSLNYERAYNFSATLKIYGSAKLSGEITAYYNYINDFIYLAPVQPATLTIKGAFPTFHYRQADATFKGVDIGFTWNIYKGLKLTSKGSLLRARNITANEYLVMMPADRIENTLGYDFNDIRGFKENYISFSVLNVLKQWRVPANSDYVAPPQGYLLLNVDAGTSIALKKQKLGIGAGVNNLLNTVYRDYLNRFRYFSDEAGINFSIRINYSF